MIGKDRRGWNYHGQLAYAVQELADKHELPPPDASEDSIRDAQVIQRTIWGLFNLAS